MIRFTVPEGAGLEEIAEIIEKHSSFRKEEVLKRADDPAFVQHLMKKYPRLVTKEVFNQQIRHPLEGYFFRRPIRFMISMCRLMPYWKRWWLKQMRFFRLRRAKHTGPFNATQTAYDGFTYRGRSN